ncbi:MAG: SnoaL-like domain-containing protein, partial [Gammaproteobacteria bacterium]|nr:SnoaL-like domain-containing protein [Gammaproteobacteria bacterium]
MNFEDFAEITRRRYEYAQGIDTRDFKLLRSIFTQDITMDFEDYSGQPSSSLKAD